MASKSIVVRIGLDSNNKPSVLEPLHGSSQTIAPGPVTWEIYNSCSEPKLWIQFQGFCFTETPPLLSTTPIPVLFGSSMSFGAELNPAVPGKLIEAQKVTTPPTFPTAAAGSQWTYSILLLSNGGLEKGLDPIIVLSG